MKLEDKQMGNYLVDIVSDRDVYGNGRRRSFTVAEIIRYFEARGGIYVSPAVYRNMVRELRGPDFLNAADTEILDIE